MNLSPQEFAKILVSEMPALAATAAATQLVERNGQVHDLKASVAQLRTVIDTQGGQLTDTREERDKNHAHMTKYWTDWKASEDRVELLERLLVESGVEVPTRPEAVEP